MYKGIVKPTGEIFEIDQHNGALILKNSVFDYVGGAFDLDVQVQDSQFDDEEIKIRSAKNLIKVNKNI